MKKAAVKKSARKKDDVFRDAQRVFPSSYVNLLREKGHDFLEQGYEGSFTLNSEGRRLVDCYTSGGVFNLGRKNPAIVSRFKKAIYWTDQGNFVMPSHEKTLLAKKIAGFIPGELDCVLFGVTRGESMDAACKLARGFTARPGLVTVDGGCYGETGFALSLSGKPGKEQYGRLIQGVEVIPMGDVEAARHAIGQGTAAVIMEPMQVENRCRTAPAEYYQHIRELCNASGAKLIFDETQTGFGRTGTRFFFEQTGVEPDILIVGEAMTAGMFPMTAMIFTYELKHFFDVHPLIHLCTFGGHDLGCMVAMATLDEYERLEPWDNARHTGDNLMKKFKTLADKNPDVITSVTGMGLAISLNFASSAQAKEFCCNAYDNGLFVETGKLDPDSVLIRPSLLITEEEASGIIDGITKTLKGLDKKG